MSTQVVLLGSTGSIGTQALEVIDQHHENFEVVALSAAAVLLSFWQNNAFVIDLGSLESTMVMRTGLSA